MKKIHQQKWFQIGLPVVLVLVVVAAAVWYSSDGQFFKGQLDVNKILKRDTTQTDSSAEGQAAIEAYEAAYSNGVTEEECKQYKEWFAKCEYSCRKDDGNIAPLTACQQDDEFKDYMSDWPTDAECNALDPNDPNVDPADVAYCETKGCLHTDDKGVDDLQINAKCEQEKKENV